MKAPQIMPPGWPPPWFDESALEIRETSYGPVKLTRMLVVGTYEDRLEGLPHAKSNQRYLDAQLARARSRGARKVQLICEPSDETVPSHPLLPPVATTLWLDGPRAWNADVGADWTTLVVLWLHRERDLGPAGTLEKVIDRLDWGTFGEDATH